MYEQVTVFLYSMRRISSFTLSSMRAARRRVVSGRHRGDFSVVTPGASAVTTFAY
jgi:hypothetical protein